MAADPWRSARSVSVALQEGCVLREGWLLKESGGVHTHWDRRYFVLSTAARASGAGQHFQLEYFQSQGDKKPKGSVDMQAALSVAQEDGLLIINCPKRTWKFTPIDPQSYAEWFSVLADVVRVVNQRLRPSFTWEELSGNEPRLSHDIDVGLEPGEAALALQALGRGFLARRRCQGELAAARELRQRAAAAVVVLQLLRARRDRARFQRQARAVRCLQAWARMATARAAYRVQAAKRRPWLEHLVPGELVLHSGVLSKHRGGIKHTRRRTLLLTSLPRLVYFDSETNEMRGQVLGSLVLAVNAVEGASGQRLDVTTPGRVYEWEADTAEAASEWIEALRHVVEANELERGGGHAGWCYKRALSSVLLPNWKRRWVMLAGHVLRWSDSPGARPKGHVTLTKDSVVRVVAQEGREGYCLELATPDMRKGHTWIMSLPSEEERDSWLLRLREEKARLSHL